MRCEQVSHPTEEDSFPERCKQATPKMLLVASCFAICLWHNVWYLRLVPCESFGHVDLHGHCIFAA